MEDSKWFANKRPWSRIKDQILATYLPAYLSKVGRLNRRIVIVDAFAGAGKFDDGSAGSPLLICQAAERHAKGRYRAIFINKDRRSHEKLGYVLQQWTEAGTAVVLRGSAENLLAEVLAGLGDSTVFVYMDPFGLTGCEFSTLQPFLERDRRYSTEMLTSLDASAIHRCAAGNVERERLTVKPEVEKSRLALSAVLGGDYWEGPMWDPLPTAEQRITAVMAAYRSGWRTWVCPSRVHVS